MDAVFDELKKVDATYVENAIATPDHAFELARRQPRPNCIVWVTPHPCEQQWVSMCSDLLVGFYADWPTTVRVSIGRHEVCTHKIAAGQFAFAFEGRFAVPLMHDAVTLCCTDDIHCVYARMFVSGPEGRMFKETRKIQLRLEDGSNVQYENGRIRVGYPKWTHLADGPFFELPDLLSPPFPQMSTVVERMWAIREDLAKKTWNPSRLRQWCLDHDDEFCVSDNAKISSKLYLDDVLLLEDFIADELDDLVASFECGPRPRVIPGVLPAIRNELRRRRMTSVSVVGDKVVYDDDETYRAAIENTQGEGHALCLAVYLDDAASRVAFGGKSGSKIEPKKGRCTIFDVRCPREVRPLGASSRVLACECVFRRSTQTC